MPADRFNDYTFALWSAVVSGFVAVGAWLVRRILTNQAQIEDLRREIGARDARREAEMALIVQMQLDIREVRREVRSLFTNNKGGHDE